MFEIIKKCKKHGALTRIDVQFRKTRKSADCKHCAREWRQKDQIKNPEKYKKYRERYKKISISADLSEKGCSRCKKILSIDNFTPAERSNRYGYCRLCRSIANNISKLRNSKTYKISRQKTKIKQREKSLIKKYNLNLSQYQKIHDSQNGVCKICGDKETALQPNGREKKDLCVDHCHKTNKVRGLLCHSCNAGLGHFFDSVVRLEQAIEYLEANS